MRQASNKHPSAGALRRIGLGLLVAFILVGVTGVRCSGDAGATFRETATESIGNGVKDILTGVVDGLVAAIEEAGRNGDDGA